MQYWAEPSSIFSASYHQVSVHTSKAPLKAVSSQDEQTQLHSLCEAPCALVPNPFGDLSGSLSSRSVSVLHVGASGWGQHAGPGQWSRILPQTCWLYSCLCSPGCDVAAASWLLGALLPDGQPGILGAPRHFLLLLDSHPWPVLLQDLSIPGAGLYICFCWILLLIFWEIKQWVLTLHRRQHIKNHRIVLEKSFKIIKSNC